MKHPKNTCWCCGEELQQLTFLDEIPTCDECRAAAEEAREVCA